MKLAIFVQGCVLAGGRAWRIEETEDWNNGDVATFEGDVAHLAGLAADLDELATDAPAGTDLYYMRVARTIREAIV